MIALKIFRKLLFFCMFSLFNFFIHFSRGSADTICLYVRTPMFADESDEAVQLTTDADD